MRHLLLFLLSLPLIPALAQGPAVSDNFEGNGAIATWYSDDCGIDPSFANPFPQGINPSATVLKYTDTGGAYANVGFDVRGHFDLSEQAVFSLKAYIPSNSLTGDQPNQISLKLQNGGLSEPWSTQSEIIQPLVLDQWQAVTFDFANGPFLNLDPDSPPPVNRPDFSRVVLQVNGENNNEQVTAYLDDFDFTGRTVNDAAFDRLVWSDEFNNTGAIDPEKWHHQTQLPNGASWYNGEVQHYTSRLDNSYVERGLLHIVAKKENFTDQGQTKAYTSARLNSKFAFTYGRVEVRARLPFGLGTWPAIWMLGKNIAEPGGFWASEHGTVSWPACGEIDIMEHWGYNQNYIQSALHTPSSSGATVNLGGILAEDVSNLFHVYALEWTPDEMQFSIDGQVYYTYAPDTQNAATWPFDADQYLLLNVAMAGEIAPGFTQSPMIVDFVRVYQQSPVSSSGAEKEFPFQLFPNPVKNTLNIRAPETLQGTAVKVYSPAGKLLQSAILEGGGLSFNWAGYPKGVYLVTFEVGGEQVAYKVVKI